MNVTPTATKPFEIVHMDTYTLEQSKFLTILDSFSKYAQAYPLKSLAATEIVDNLLMFFSHHGVPKQIILDNGTEFKNSVVTELLQLHKVKIHFISPHHPQSNGNIERLHSTISEHVKLLNAQNFNNSSINQKMTYSIMAYNHSIHSATKMKPIDIINGHITDNDPFDVNLEQLLLSDYITNHKEQTKLLYSTINEKLAQSKEKRVSKINQNRENPDLFEAGQNVYLKKHTRQKLAEKFTKPEKITKVNKKRKTIMTNAHGKIHMANVKRPLPNTYSFD